jgi:uncharacterized protein
VTSLLAAIITATCIVLGWCVYAYFIEPFLLRTTRMELSFPNLPESLDGFTICQLSDIHSVKAGQFEAVLGKALSRIEADLCVVTGDIVSSRRGLEALPVVFRGLKPRLGTLAVPGNGDYRFGVPITEIADGLREVGVRLLRNESVTLAQDGGALHIMGVDDPHRRLDDLDQAESLVAVGGFRLLLAHSPDILVRVREDTAHLILAGHTHGGQIRVPFLGALWLHCHEPLGIAMGYFGPERLSAILRRPMPDTRLYVSRGLGGSSVRARFMCRPEIVLITLRRG